MAFDVGKNEINGIYVMTRPGWVWKQVSTRGPQLTGWTNQRERSRHTSLRRIQWVNDAGALAPVVFSGQPETGKRKIQRINGKGGPYPPKSRAANTMVRSSCPESSWISWFETHSSKNPNNGMLGFLRVCLHVMHLMWPNHHPEFK